MATTTQQHTFEWLGQDEEEFLQEVQQAVEPHGITLLPPLLPTTAIGTWSLGFEHSAGLDSQQMRRHLVEAVEAVGKARGEILDPTGRRYSRRQEERPTKSGRSA